MITARNIEMLDNMVKKYALMDFFRANPKPLKRYRNGETNYVPYSLSPLTNEAREMLKLARQEEISREDEEKVKGYLLLKRMNGEMVEDFEAFKKKIYKEKWGRKIS